MQQYLLIILVFTIAYAMMAKRLSSTIITAPMMFLLLGFLLEKLDVINIEQAEPLLHLIAEISLIVLLFLDASQTDLKSLKSKYVWPTRMLLIGLPLAVGLGFIASTLFFPGIPLIVLALVAAILSPTDAALGQAVVSNKGVPVAERQCLTVESGLNDGLALPIILLFAYMLASLGGADQEGKNWLLFGIKQIILGPLVGITIGWLGGKMFLIAESRQLTAPTFEGIAVLALAGCAYIMAELVQGNGFISAFTAGLAFGNLVKGHCRFIYEFTESEGQMLIWTSFLLIGLVLVPEAIQHLTWPMFSFILFSLLIVRPVSIYISLLGTDSKKITRIFLGWYGPRGLATALFALLVIKGVTDEYADFVLYTAINAVWISAILHGISAAPGANWYAKKIKVIIQKDQP